MQDGVLKDGVPVIGPQVGAGLQQYRSDSEARLLDWTSDGALLVAVHEAGQDQMRRLMKPLRNQNRSCWARRRRTLQSAAHTIVS